MNEHSKGKWSIIKQIFSTTMRKKYPELMFWNSNVAENNPMNYSTVSENKNTKDKIDITFHIAKYF